MIGVEVVHGGFALVVFEVYVGAGVHQAGEKVIITALRGADEGGAAEGVAGVDIARGKGWLAVFKGHIAEGDALDRLDFHGDFLGQIEIMGDAIVQTLLSLGDKQRNMAVRLLTAERRSEWQKIEGGGGAYGVNGAAFGVHRGDVELQAARGKLEEVLNGRFEDPLEVVLRSLE